MGTGKPARANVTGKILQADYDFIFAQAGECAVCLTNAEIQWILSQADYASWETRWLSSSGQNIDTDKISAFAGNLMLKLLQNCQQCEDEMYILRQNPTDPCQLQQSIDGGATWTLAFDYALCLNSQASNPPEYRYDPETTRIQQSFDGGETWEDAPDGRYDTPQTPNPHSLEIDPPCWTANNVIEYMKKFLDVDDEQLLVVVVELFASIIALILGQAWALPILVQVVTAIINIGIDTIQAAMTETEWDKFLANLYCHADSAGNWSLPAFFAIVDQLSEDHSGDALFFLKNILLQMGWSGLNNAGHLDEFTGEVDCSAIPCGDLDCGFVTTSTTNRNRWTVAETLFEEATFTNPPAVDLVSAGVAMAAGGSYTLAAFTTFDHECYITKVSLYTLGRGGSSAISVGVKTTEDGEWQSLGVQTLASWSAGVVKEFTVNLPVWAIQVQSKAASGQNNFSQVGIYDPTP